MERFFKYFLKFCAAGFIITMGWAAVLKPGVHDPTWPGDPGRTVNVAPPDTILPYPFNDNSGNPYDPGQNGGLYLNNPSNIKEDLIYDPDANEYILSTKIGEMDYRPANYMSFQEYLNYDADRAMQQYWKQKTHANRISRQSGSLFGPIRIGKEDGIASDIFGGNTIDIRPSGSAELIFGVISTRTDNPALDVKQRRNTNFDFQEKIQMNVTAKIGDKIQFGVNYNTEASFDFENKMNLKYEGKEDEIIQLIEAGDVTMPLNSTLITGSQALFGIKTKLKFGRTTVTGIYSQQKSKTENITVSGGAQTSEFELKSDQYEENKHFFLAQYFRDNYTDALSKLPIIQSPVNITKMEVWITNIGAATQENRNIVAFQDIGEPHPYNPAINGHPVNFPNNTSNDLFENIDTAQIRNLNTVNNYLTGFGLMDQVDFVKVELARKLNASEFTYNSKLGFISLNTTLNTDQVLAVAFQYTLIGDTTVYQVGEFSNEGVSAPNCLAVKLLKSTALNTKIPMWNLMMKNVYAIGGYQVNPEDFRLNILYSGEENGVPMGYLTEGLINGIPLIKVLKCDRLNSNGDPVSDGVFDFIGSAATMGGTIQETNGRIFFPVLEPFGDDLREAITGGNTSDPALNALADKYCYDSLYSMTKTGAQQYPDKNKFSIAGFFKSASGSEISLGAMNVPQGSVKVTAGGIPLTENVDYTVDYTLGRVKIINEGILNSGTPINISLESNNMFDIQTKTLMGLHVDYMVNRNFNLGATVLNLSEKPLTQKVNFGDEPISNTIWGINGDYKTDSRLLTKIIDWLPFIETKAESNITASGEFAHLIPGHSKAIGTTGTSYIDDFEGSKSSIDLRTIQNWFLASTPQHQPDMFPESAPNSMLAFNFNRARLAWYVIDPSVFYRGNNQTPDHITKDDISNHFVREVYEDEVFPQKENSYDTPQNIALLNLAFYPSEKGPYNFDVDGSEGYSSGISADGRLQDPETRWGGITRKLETTDFEATNVEYIEFWMMDPFVYNPSHTGGNLYFDLGDISEDVLRDSRKSVENGLPPDGVYDNLVDTTLWGLVPNQQPLTNSFDANEDARQYQDVGLDGISSENEDDFFADYLAHIAATYGTNSQAYLEAASDPSSDDYHYFRGPDYDTETKSILQRYKKYNNTDGNSPTNQQSLDEYGVDYTMMATTLPDGEDINRDNTLNESERYFQYRVELRPDKMVVGENYIADVRPATSQLANGSSATVNWYQFKIPIQSPDRIVNGISDFKSIRFIRVFLKDFADTVICRFATLDLVRSEWRRYKYSLLAPGEYIPDDDQSETTFDVSAVNIEENSERTPVPYVIPPGIEREVNVGSTNLQQLNEQSLDLKVCNLLDGDSRAVYKTCDFDMRQFKKLKMYVHGEAGSALEPLNDGDLTVFVRLGSDFTTNFYEYEIPITVTEWGTPLDRDDLIWPDANNMEISLEDLVNAKKDRNTAMRADGSTLTTNIPYITYDEANHKITVVGNPSLSAVKTIMIGVRNPLKRVTSTDDGNPKCAEIWVNELRLTDFDEDGGWAATARINAALADFGNLSLAGTISTPGFGSIDKKINERQKETIVSYDIATNLELGKFFPEKWGLKIPMHYDFSELRSTPQYNPLNPDIIYKEDISTYESHKEKDSIREITQDYTRRQSLNFMNVRKTKVSGSSKTHIWDVENLDLSYAYTEIFQRSVDIEYYVKKTHQGGLGYNFTGNPKPFKPFDRVKFLNNKYLRIIKDFNLFYMPKLLSFRTDLDKQYSENLMRNKTNAIILLEPTYIKSFNWTRDYGLKWDLTQNLKVDYNADANARVDEPAGRIDRSNPNYKELRDSVWNNILDFGRLTTYNQQLDVTYNVPINKLPFLNWITATVKYGGDYQWTALPLSTDSLNNIIKNPLGNIIENSNTQQLNINGNLLNLYNLVPYLKKINDKKRQTKPAAPRTNMPSAEDTVKNKINWGKEIIDNTLSLLMSVKSVNISYQENNGKMLPGFMNEPIALGNDWNHNAPGLDFVFGSPSEIFGGDNDIRYDAFSKGWMSSDTNLNTAFAIKQSKTLNGQITAEPFPSFRIDITANSTFTKVRSSYLRYAEDPNSELPYDEFSPMETGSFSMSYITWGTAFTADNKDNSNAVFEQFKEYRILIAERLAAENPFYTGLHNDSTGFPDGYGPTSQEVLIPAFLAAYAKKDPNKISLKPFSEKLLAAIPLPNWKVTYTGLTRIRWIKKWFKNISVSHAYRNTYSVGSYVTSVRFDDKDGDGYTNIRDAAKNFLSEKEIGQISINEQFNPLIGFDMTMVNSLLLKFEIRKSRNLAMSFANTQLTEVSSDEYVIGAGYRIKDVTFNIKTGGRSKPIKSDLNIKADFSYRNNKTVLRKLVENMDQVSAGQRVMTIGVSADYQISEKFNIRLFFDKIINNPWVTSQYRNSNTNAGISLKFTLAQ